MLEGRESAQVTLETLMQMIVPAGSHVTIDGQEFSLISLDRDGFWLAADHMNGDLAAQAGKPCRLMLAGLGEWKFNIARGSPPASGNRPADDASTLFLKPGAEPDQRVFQDALHGLRKSQHVLLCNGQDVEAFDKKNGLDQYHFHPCSLPELDFDDLDTSTELFGRRFPLPLLITGMTGGSPAQSDVINHRLASAAASLGLPMGVGSQRPALDNPALAQHFRLKASFPSLYLIGNIGFTQVLQARDPLGLLRQAATMIDADAMAIHVNPLQECLQPEGDRHFRGFYDALARVLRGFELPLYVKEVGSGMDPVSAERLASLGLRTLDVGGRGGTAWGYIEGLRSARTVIQRLGAGFRDWGLPTAVSLREIHARLPQLELIATGGIRSGIEVAKAVALGARACGLGLPLMRAALKGDDAAMEILDEYSLGLKITMLSTGSSKLEGLCRNLWRGVPFEGQAVSSEGPGQAHSMSLPAGGGNGFGARGPGREPGRT